MGGKIFTSVQYSEAVAEDKRYVALTTSNPNIQIDSISAELFDIAGMSTSLGHAGNQQSRSREVVCGQVSSQQVWGLFFLIESPISEHENLIKRPSSAASTN
jgi:hypothetical protein